MPVPFALAALLISSVAGAQDARLRERLDPATATAVGAIVDSAARSGIPREPLIEKALEGAVKRAPGARISAAVRQLAASLGTAREALGPRASTAELVAGAGALQAGVRGDAIREIRGRRQGSLTVALATLADLVSEGVPAGNAVEAVRIAVERGASDADLVTLRTAVGRDIKAGTSPASAASSRARGIGAARSANPPSARTGAARSPGKSEKRK